MLASGGRESFQELSDNQDSSSRMQELALSTHSLAGQASTTVTIQNQGIEGDSNTQLDSSGVTSSRGRSTYLSHHNTSHRSYVNSSDGVTHYDPLRCVTTRSVNTMGGGILSHTADNTVSCGDDLTSLSWLHSLDMGGMVPHLATPPTPPASPQPHNPQISYNTHTPPSDRKRRIEVQDKQDRIDYSQDGSAKPPYSYAALIGMAMKENQNKMTLSAIYNWIRENFAYYKTADPSWQNSIRHNLSLNKCFLKVPRNKNEPGKGGFWRLDPEYADSLVDGVFKKRRPTRHTLPPPSKSKRNRRLPCYPSPQQQQQQHQQQGQQLGVKVLLQQPQAAFMPPPTNKPPPRATLYIEHDGTEVDREASESASSLKDELVWSTILGEEVHDDAWPCRTQELVTDLSQTGDPSTYPTTLTTSHPHQHSLPHQQLDFSDHLGHHQIITITTSTTPSLPSLELSPASLGVEEDLFTSPDCSEASNDDADSLTSSLEINNDGSWSKGVYEELPSMNTFCNSLTQLRPLEPSTAPVLVQDAHAWGPDTNWDDSRTLSLLDANLDLENLIDLDEL